MKVVNHIVNVDGLKDSMDERSFSLLRTLSQMSELPKKFLEGYQWKYHKQALFETGYAKRVRVHNGKVRPDYRVELFPKPEHGEVVEASFHISEGKEDELLARLNAVD